VACVQHEMIHAFVFVSSPVKDHDDHGPVFQSHMHRINQDAGTKITVFHTFHDEVDAYRQHWWQCDVCPESISVDVVITC
jgi:predicted SprT family Zn-dependent metalloprotease